MDICRIYLSAGVKYLNHRYVSSIRIRCVVGTAAYGVIDTSPPTEIRSNAKMGLAFCVSGITFESAVYVAPILVLVYIVLS